VAASLGVRQCSAVQGGEELVGELVRELQFSRNSSASKSNPPIQKPLLFVTEAWTRDNIRSHMTIYTIVRLHSFFF
jgi:hypothetical protein